MNFKKLVACLCLLGGAAVVAQTADRAIESGATRIEVLGQNFKGLPPITVRQARLVVYSLDDLPLSGATSIFVNGAYHASLVRGAYSDLCYSTGNVEVGARQMEVGQRPKDRPDSLAVVELQGARTHYLRVREQAGRPVLEPVPVAQAERELPAKRLQLHTISRAAQDCMVSAEPVVAVTTPAEPTRHALSQDTLFAFARSDLAGLTSDGQRAIEQLLERLRSDYSRIERLHIIGHADPLGDVAHNERLSIDRATTVRLYIDNTARLGVPTSVESRGSRELVVTDCARANTAQARACNQPNRRVVIEVTGVRR